MIFTGLHLPRRLTSPRLHHFARSSRQADPIWLHRSLRTECRDSWANGVLLEQSPKQRDASTQARRERQTSHKTSDNLTNDNDGSPNKK